MDKRSETVLGRWSNLGDSISKSLTNLGLALLPFADVGVKIFTDLADGLESVVKWFTQLDPPMQAALLGLTGIVAAAGPILLFLGSFASAIISLNGALTIMTGTGGLAGVTSALSFLGPAVAVVAGAFAAWKLASWAYDNIPAVQKLGNAVADMLLKIAGIEGTFTGAKKGLQEATDGMLKSLGPLEAKLKEKGIIIDKTGKSVEQYALAVNKAVRELPDYVAKTVTAGGAQEGLEKKLINLRTELGKHPPGWSKVADAAASAAKKMQEHLDSMWKGISSWLSEISSPEAAWMPARRVRGCTFSVTGEDW
jgi:hypothetical protein